MRTPRALPVYPWGDSEKLYFGDGSDYAIYFDGTNFLIDSGTHKIKLDLATAGEGKIYGGLSTGDALSLYANATDAYPWIDILGNGDIEIRSKSDIYFTSSANYSFQFRYINPDCIITSLAANKNLVMLAKGTGRIDFRSANTTGSDVKVSYPSAITTTGNIIGHEIDASTNLTMGVNLGATGLKINVIAPNGSGVSRGIDLSSLAVDFPVFGVVSDPGNTAGTLTGQIAIEVAGTTYYLYYYTTSTVA